MTSQRVEVNGKFYALEGATNIHEDTMFTAIDKDHFIQKIVENNKKLYIDPLTGAYNRRYFDEQLSKLGSESALAIIDLDKFKQINDTYGHLVGDEVLKEVVATFKANVRPADAVIRYGGDEFVIVFLKTPADVFKKKLEKSEHKSRVCVLRRNRETSRSQSASGVNTETLPTSTLLMKQTNCFISLRKPEIP